MCWTRYYFYGTLVISQSHRFFNIEDIYYFKGINISHYNQSQKFKLLHNIFLNYIKQVIYTSNDVVFSLPIIKYKFDDIINTINLFLMMFIIYKDVLLHLIILILILKITLKKNYLLISLLNLIYRMIFMNYFIMIIIILHFLIMLLLLPLKKVFL